MNKQIDIITNLKQGIGYEYFMVDLICTGLVELWENTKQERELKKIKVLRDIRT